MAVLDIPSAGQLVTARQRRFVVTEVRASGVQLDLYAPAKGRAVQHLVSIWPPRSMVTRCFSSVERHGRSLSSVSDLLQSGFEVDNGGEDV